MATQQDCSIGISVPETTFKTPVTVTRWLEYVSESLDWRKNIKQGQGIRVGTRVARSGRRVITSADGGGDIMVECLSKGMGLFWQAHMGAGSSSLVSGATYQQLFTLGEPGSNTLQKGLVEAGGTVDAYTFPGTMFDSFELACANADILQLKMTADAADLLTATAYATPSYPSEPVNLYHFANGAITSGTLTAPTATTLASGATTVADVRSFSVAVGNNLTANRLNFGAGGRKAKQLRGLRTITGKMDVEYDNTTFRDALLADSPMNFIATFTGGALSTGVETLQIVIPEIKFDNELAKTNGTDLIVQSMAFQGLDNLTAAQPMWIGVRTADTAL